MHSLAFWNPTIPDIPRLPQAGRINPFPCSVGKNTENLSQAALGVTKLLPQPITGTCPPPTVSMPLALLSAVSGQEDSAAAVGDSMTD